MAALAQGITLGALLQGIVVEGREYAGGWWDWLSPFSLLTGVSLVVGYGLLGATWLIVKTEGGLQDKAFRMARWLGVGLLGCIALVSAATPFLEGAYYQRWFSWPNIAWLSPVPLLTAALAWQLWRGLERRREAQPFIAAIGLFTMGYLGLAISLWPHIVPHEIDLWEAAAGPRAQAFLLVGTLFLLPIIVGYMAWSYWVFRGKVRHGVGYH